MVQLMQICGDAIEQGNALDPPNLWDTQEFLWRSTYRGGVRGAAGLLLLPTVRSEASVASVTPPTQAGASAPSGASPVEAAPLPEAAPTPAPRTPEITQHTHHHPVETTTAFPEEAPTKRARLLETTSRADQRAPAGSGPRDAEELPMLIDITIRPKANKHNHINTYTRSSARVPAVAGTHAPRRG